jgi:YD repeat-containing protein
LDHHVRALLGLVALIGCASAPAVPVVHAVPDRQHPGPCVSEEEGPQGRVVVTYEYGPQARIVREIERGGSRMRQRMWSYDDAGRRARELLIDGDRVHAIWYVYDDRGQLVATEEDATGKRDVVLRRAREYDARGRLVRMATTRPDGATIEEHALHYDDAGRLALELVERGSESDVIDIDLDPAGRIVARRGQRETQRFAYSLTGRLASMTVDRHGRLQLVNRYGYDDAGNLLTAETLDGDGTTVRTIRHTYACW